MKYLLPLLLIAAPALAQQPEVPSTVALPSNVVLAIRQYLGQKPYDEVSRLIQALEACVRAQMPGGTNGRDCAAVVAAKPRAGQPAPTKTR